LRLNSPFPDKAIKNRTELSFSACGRYLYQLLVCFADTGERETTCRVFLSAFLSAHMESEEAMSPCEEMLRLTYRFGENSSKLRAPYVLCHWATDRLYLSLPFLSCNTKIIRFSLLGGNLVTSEPRPGLSRIETLESPVYFPNSTPNRRPKMLYRPTQGAGKDILVLALDGVSGSDDGESNEYPPTVIQWKIDGRAGWRAWDEKVDSEEPGLRENARSYERLRGTFVDADRRFNVVVRSGLNWRRKAYISCL
jgi:hypothetical protein